MTADFSSLLWMCLALVLPPAAVQTSAEAGDVVSRYSADLEQRTFHMPIYFYLNQFMAVFKCFCSSRSCACHLVQVRVLLVPGNLQRRKILVIASLYLSQIILDPWLLLKAIWLPTVYMHSVDSNLFRNPCVDISFVFICIITSQGRISLDLCASYLCCNCPQLIYLLNCYILYDCLT